MKRENLQQALADLEPHEPEKQIKITKDEWFEQTLELILKRYEEIAINKLWGIYIDINDHSKGHIPNLTSLFEYARKSLPHKLINPNMISEFLFHITKYQHEERFSENTGNFLSALIMSAYDNGYNNFELPATLFDARIDRLCKLQGKKDRLLEITIKGNLGHTAFAFSKHIDAKVYGNVTSEFAWGAEDCTFIIRGRVGPYLVRTAKRCVFRSPYKRVLNYINRIADEGCSFYWIKGKKEELVFKT